MKKLRAILAAATLAASVSTAHAAGPSCQLTFRLGTSTPLVSASVFVIYQSAPGDFPGNTTAVSCQLANGLVGNIADADQTRSLTITLAGTPNSIQGPRDIATCTWTPTSRFPVTGDFNLSGQSGFNMSFQQVDANITLSNISCSGTITTTTTSTSSTSSTSTSSTTLAAAPLCGDFDGDGSLKAADALGILRTAVGQRTCELCRCDINNSGAINASDALVALKVAIGQSVPHSCPAC